MSITDGLVTLGLTGKLLATVLIVGMICVVIVISLHIKYNSDQKYHFMRGVRSIVKLVLEEMRLGVKHPFHRIEAYALIVLVIMFLGSLSVDHVSSSTEFQIAIPLVILLTVFVSAIHPGTS